MQTLLRRIGGVAGMALNWALIWTLAGLMVELANLLVPSAPTRTFIEHWPLALSIPGLMGGALFAFLLACAEHRYRLGELSLLRFAVWGALTGLLLGGLAVGSGAFDPDFPNPALRGVAIVAPILLLCVLSAIASLALARRAAPWRAVLVRLGTRLPPERLPA